MPIELTWTQETPARLESYVIHRFHPSGMEFEWAVCHKTAGPRVLLLQEALSPEWQAVAEAIQRHGTYEAPWP